jgi:hypothetical protein
MVWQADRHSEVLMPDSGPTLPLVTALASHCIQYNTIHLVAYEA